MRRLPVFFVIDVSESMVGEPLRRMEEGIENIVSTLRRDPHALETVYICLIAFAGTAKTITPLIDLVRFYPPKIPLGGGTALGKALNVLMEEIDSQVQQTTYENRGDWEPIVFLITDGKPTDNPAATVTRWCQEYAARATLVAITLGTNADIPLLGRLTDHIVALENATEEHFRTFIDRVSASVQAQSQRVDFGGKTGGVSLEKASELGLTVVDDVNQFAHLDPDVVVLTGRCCKTKKPYLLKYVRSQTDGIPFIKTPHFGLEGGFALDESYFDWSSEQTNTEQVSTSLLDGVPPCPHCGNPTSFAHCSCNHLLCLDASGLARCPWCDKLLQFDMSAGGGGNFNVNRGQG